MLLPCSVTFSETAGTMLPFGPAEGVIDYGARLIAAFASVIDSEDPEEIEAILDGIPDPTGQFYRFNLAGSLLKANRSAFEKA